MMRFDIFGFGEYMFQMILHFTTNFIDICVFNCLIAWFFRQSVILCVSLFLKFMSTLLCSARKQNKPKNVNLLVPKPLGCHLMAKYVRYFDNFLLFLIAYSTCSVWHLSVWCGVTNNTDSFGSSSIELVLISNLPQLDSRLCCKFPGSRLVIWGKCHLLQQCTHCSSYLPSCKGMTRPSRSRTNSMLTLKCYGGIWIWVHGITVIWPLTLIDF